MGLLQYKAHCTTSYDTPYAIATDDEMRTFLQNLDVHMCFENSGQGADGKIYFNIVLRFTPFPVKYLNYIKRYNRPRKGESWRVRGSENSPHGMGNKDDSQHMVYVQLFRIPKRNVCKGSFNSASLRNARGWGAWAMGDCYDAWCGDIYKDVCRITYNTVTPYGGLLYTPAPRFRHPLTPMAAAKGSVLMLQNCTILDGHGSNLWLEFGTDNRSQQNFRHGLVAGFAYNGHYAYNSEEETLTMRNTHGLF